MAAVVTYIRSFMALFVIVLLLQQLVPGTKLKRYIQFFSEIILSMGLLFPVLSWVFDSDAFLQKIQYEAFAESLSELTRDTKRMEFMQQDYYLEEYENAVSEEVGMVAETYAAPYGLCVTEAEVSLTEAYEIAGISIVLSEEMGTSMVVEPIIIREEKPLENDAICSRMKEELLTCYQLDEDLVTVQYRRGGSSETD